MFTGNKVHGLWENIGPADIVIPVIDYHQHNPDYKHEFIFDSYGWNTNQYAHANVEGTSSIGFVPGAGAALNCMMPLVNTVGMDDWVRMSNVDLHRSKDPGVGAFTPFYNRQLISRGHIPKGDELFDR